MQVATKDTSILPIIGPTQKKPSQVKFIRPAQMSLFAKVSCYPPLGQVTCVRRVQKKLKSEEDDTLRFTVVLESSSTFPEQSWEAQIWHNLNNSTEWTALELQKCDSTFAPLLAGSDTEYKYNRYVFSGVYTLPSTGGSAQFTVRYRTSPEAEWQWANQQRRVNDGELVYGPRKSRFDEEAAQAQPVGQPVPSTEPAPAGQPVPSAESQPSTESAPPLEAPSGAGREDFGKYIENLSPEVEVEARRSEAPGSVLWDVSGKVDGAKEGHSGVKKIAIGVPSSTIRYFSLVRVWTPWLAPRHGKDMFRITEDAILCSFLRNDGTHLVILAISGTNNVLTVFQSGESGELVVQATNDNEEESKFQVLASVAEDFEVAMCAIVYEARKLARQYAEANAPENVPREQTPHSPPGDDVVMVEKDPKAQWMSEWYDGLTYCTWNGLGQNLTEEKIIDALEALRKHGIKIINLIIDDNWQSLDREAGDSQFKRRWKQFEANPDGFPEGLRKTVEAIRRSQPSIRHIAVWHALMGYWGGISPDGELAQKYKTKEVKVRDPVAGGTMLAIDPDDIFQFYEDFYSYLTYVGIDSVKADAQFYLDLLEDPEDRRRFTNAYQDAWSIASLKHFSTRSISCMSLIPQTIFHSQLPTNKPSILLRNSDDFFPDILASHPWHVFCNAHNALLTRHLNALPDWDMFQTSHPYASFHAAARCVSGGPIYITDEPGKHDLDTINQMTAPTTHGDTVILRPSVIGRSLGVYHDYNEGNVLRVGTYTGWARTGSGIIGLFNVDAADATCMVSLMDFPGIHEDSTGQYIVRAHTSGRISNLMKPSSPDSLVSVSLEQKGWEILTAYPTRSFTLKGSRGCESNGDKLTQVAVLGLLGKMTGAAALVNSDVFIVENGRLRFDISLKALGTLGIYFSDLHDRSIAKNFMVMISGKAVPRKTVWKEGGENAKVLAVDVLSAWKYLGLDSGWSNEIFVQVYVG